MAGAWCRGQERLYSPSGPSWPVMGAPLPYLLHSISKSHSLRPQVKLLNGLILGFLPPLLPCCNSYFVTRSSSFTLNFLAALGTQQLFLRTLHCFISFIFSFVFCNQLNNHTHGNWYRSVGRVTTARTGLLRNRGSISRRNKSVFSNSLAQSGYQLWAPFRLLHGI